MKIGLRRILAIILPLGFIVPLTASEAVHAKHGMVVSMEEHGTDAGLKVLRAGGNAVDAAVAVGFALAVTHPFAGNLGGGGYMTIHMADGRNTFIDFREMAPGKASHDMYLDAQGNATRDSLQGWRSSGVPGTVRGLEMAQKKYGKKTWAEDMAPAIDLASNGYVLSYTNAETTHWGLRAGGLGRDPETKRIYQRDGNFYQMGDTLKLPELAATLSRIAKNGADEFYEGDTAKRFAEEEAKHGGLITTADLHNYKAIEREPVTGQYHGYTIISAPPSSSGGVTILEILGILDGTGYEKDGAGSASEIHYLAEAMRRAYADRNAYLGDPAFVKNPIAGLLDPKYLAKLRATIDPIRATPSEQIKPGTPAGAETQDTTHFSVVDGEGNAVAVTYTLNGGFGNGITVPGLGFLLNNEMDDFASKPGAPNGFGLVQGEANSIAPGKRPLSSMAPTILLKDGKVFMTVGAPGGSRIPTAVLQTILDVVDFHMNAQEAVDFPRVHHQWLPDTLSAEPGISSDTVALLKERGYKVDARGGAEVAAIVNDGGWLQGACDSRVPNGKAAGY
ncbi:MAG TPA: gamma-glutamyltransferase [Vicinamibacterales bacterium]|jgi:gamma-glutamyltranspeptidase/glutathione hydrolase|nr:gamma-glutamyltransferase [Vicinamibacterales bacterium]